MQLRLAAAVAGLILLVLFTFVWRPPQADSQLEPPAEVVEDAGPELLIAPPPEDLAAPGVIRKTDRLVQPAGGSTLSPDVVLPPPVVPPPQAGSAVQAKPRPKPVRVPVARQPMPVEAGSGLRGRPVPRPAPPVRIPVLPEAGSAAARKAGRLPAMPPTVNLAAGLGQQPAPTPTTPTATSTLAKHIAVNSDGSQMAVGDSNGELRLIDVESRSVTQKIALESGALLDLLYTPDGALLATATGHQLLLFDPVSGEIVRRYKTDDTYSAIALLPGGEHVIATSLVGRIVRLSLTTGERTVVGAHPTAVSAFAVSPDGRFVATGSLDGSLRIWNLDVPGAPQVTETTFAGLQCLTFTPDSRRLAGVGSAASVRLWNFDRGLIAEKNIAVLQKTSTLKFTRDPRHLYVAGKSPFSYVSHIDLETGNITPLTNGNPPSSFRDMATSSDGLTLATLLIDRSIQILTLDPTTSTLKTQYTITAARDP